VNGKNSSLQMPDYQNREKSIRQLVRRGVLRPQRLVERNAVPTLQQLAAYQVVQIDCIAKITNLLMVRDQIKTTAADNQDDWDDWDDSEIEPRAILDSPIDVIRRNNQFLIDQNTRRIIFLLL